MQRLQDEGRISELVEFQNNLSRLGVDAPFDFHLNALRRDDRDEVEIRTVCILVDFDDNEADEDRYPLEHYQELLFSRNEYRTGSMRDWYLENSRVEVEIIGQVYGWYRMPHDYAWYVDGARGFGDYPRNARGLVLDALIMADDDIDFREFDNDDNGVVEALFVVHAGLGAEETHSNDMIWSHAWTVPEFEFDDMSFDRYAMEPENGKIGVFGHELGHSLFGLPDLYDTEYNSAGVGMWSMMSGGSWGGNGTRPVHFDAWCKKRIGFIEPVVISENTENIIQEPVETDGDVFVIWYHGEVGSEYFLLENRQSIGFDESIPGTGLLIWHVDENMRDNAHPWYPGHENQGHNIVALEQADGDFDLERYINEGDTGDPWPGSSWNTLFAYNTEPSSRDYEGEDTEVTVYNIETLPTGRIAFDIGVYIGVGPEPAEIFLLERIPDDHRYPHPDNDEETTDEVTLFTGLLSSLWVEPSGHDAELPGDLSDFNVVIYLESWRDGDESGGGLSLEEQQQLADFIEDSGNLILVGPDVATNLQGYESPLWQLLGAEYVSEGASREGGNIRIVRAEAEMRLSGTRFPFVFQGLCDHYVDVVGSGEGSYILFQDQNRQPRGVITIGENGSRIILQPFLFGGLIDWGGSKLELVRAYFRQLRYYLEAPEEELRFPVVTGYSLIEAWPNPFNAVLNIAVGNVNRGLELAIYDVAGRRVDNLVINPGEELVQWRPKGLPSGTYWIAGKDIQSFRPALVTFLK